MRFSSDCQTHPMKPSMLIVLRWLMISVAMLETSTFVWHSLTFCSTHQLVVLDNVADKYAVIVGMFLSTARISELIWKRVPEDIHCVSKKLSIFWWLELCETLNSFQNSFTAWTSMKFATKSFIISNHTRSMLVLHYLWTSAWKVFWRHSVHVFKCTVLCIVAGKEQRQAHIAGQTTAATTWKWTSRSNLLSDGSDAGHPGWVPSAQTLSLPG